MKRSTHLHPSLLRTPRGSARLERRGEAGWLLVAGLALVGLGLAAGGMNARAQISGPDTQTPQSVPSSSAFGTADSNRTMIAVTGHDVTGGSLLYLVDTESKQLAVYSAQGGTKSTSEVRFIGARRIDLDLQVNGYNDKSEYSWKDLDAEFEKAQDPSKTGPKKTKRGAPSIPDDSRAGG